MSDEQLEEVAVRVDVLQQDVIITIERAEVQLAIAFPNTGDMDRETIAELLEIAPQIVPQALDALEAQQ